MEEREEEVDVEDETSTREGRDLPVRCASCAHPLSNVRAKISVAGAHVHCFKNPAGVEFRVVCYREAPGAVGWGERSPVWTWFPGFAWQVALCAMCKTHVGWMFAKDGDSSFVAFIDERILEPG